MFPLEREDSDLSYARFHSNKRRGSIPRTLRSEDCDGSENVAEKVNSRSLNLHRDLILHVTDFVKCRWTLLKLNS